MLRLLMGAPLERASTVATPGITVGMRMVQDVLPPRMQDTEEADVCTQMLHVGRDLQECGRAGLKQKIVNDFLVGECES